jgi:peptidoglycan/xylan/chitin deacetylase (PgdA/CDA1 family)/uncharacterized caspase-like protein
VAVVLLITLLRYIDANRKGGFVSKVRVFAILILVISWPALFPISQTMARTPVQSQAVSLKSRLDKIVDSYRKIIVLLEDDASLSEQERNRCIRIGRRIYYEKHQLLDELAQSLEEEARNAVATRFKERPEGVDHLIDYLTNNMALRDADRLAFFDMIDELLVTVQEQERATGIQKSTLHTSLQKLNDELKSIQNVYQEELARIFSRVRGEKTKREKWLEYISFLKGFFKRENILSEYPQDRDEEKEETLRGARKDNKIEIYGYDLPAKNIVLTFDDGPHRKYTDEILAILKRYGIKAFFFNVGKNLGDVDDKNGVKLGPTSAASKRAAEAGHVLANHSYSHPDLTKLNSQAKAAEIFKTSQLLEKLLGTKPNLFRPPYGAKNADTLKEIEAQGMRSVMWNMDSLDWADPIPESIAQRVLKEIEVNKRGILLFHDIHKQTVAALPRILDELVKEHYAFLTLDNGQFVPSYSSSTMAARTSGADIPEPDPIAQENPKKNYYRESWAVIIGINDYKNWPKLRYAVNDAKSIEELLVGKFGFKKSNVIKLLDGEATRERIVWALGDQMGNDSKVSKDDRVFVFFAGHGATKKLPSGKEMGYIIPVDADAEVSQTKSISMTQLQEFCELIPAKHLYFVVDSCYSGLALTRGGSSAAGSRNYLFEITKRVARQILTAGGADQQVADNGPGGHSIFTWTLLQGLQGLADTDGNSAITASELGAYISPIVSSVSRQTPAFGNLIGSEGGEFVFELQQESLTEISKQLDEEAIKLNDEFENLQKEIALKRDRNLKLRQKLEEERIKLSASQITRGEMQVPKSKKAQAQNYHNMGLKYYREKKYEDALKELEQAVKLDPKNATIINNLGFTLYKLEKYEESIVWFNKTLEIDPQRAVAYINLADAHIKLGHAKEARDGYEKYLQLSPQSPVAEDVRQKIEGLKEKN